MTDATLYTLPFSQISAADLPLVGGKGANLGEMSRAGFPVPPGFCVTTHAFRDFVAACPQMAEFYAALAELPPEDLMAARRIGEMIRQTLHETAIPDEVVTAVTHTCHTLDPDAAYAVRSSATAEDLPDASFAGQQDTYLNVRGETAILNAVRRCWASLFTDRAILYRQQNGFAHQDVALSVVVQQMVLPDVSGILFTADPVSQNRHITSIDASYGLGEALVAGLVSADLYRVDTRRNALVEVKIGDKRLAIRPLPTGGTAQQTLSDEQRTAQVLSEAQAIDLAQLGQRIAAHYQKPQDIEWAIADGQIAGHAESLGCRWPGRNGAGAARPLCSGLGDLPSICRLYRPSRSGTVERTSWRRIWRRSGSAAGHRRRCSRASRRRSPLSPAPSATSPGCTAVPR